MALIFVLSLNKRMEEKESPFVVRIAGTQEYGFEAIETNYRKGEEIWLIDPDRPHYRRRKPDEIKLEETSPDIELKQLPVNLRAPQPNFEPGGTGQPM